MSEQRTGAGPNEIPDATGLTNEQLAAIYYEGVGLINQGQYGRAIAVMRPSVNAGDRSATFAVAIAYMKGGDVEQALELYKLAAARGTDAAVAYLGYLYRVMGDNEQARVWLSRAAARGNADAVQILKTLDYGYDAAQTVMFNVMGDTQFQAGNLGMAVKDWMSAADFGSADAMVKIGDVRLSEGNVGEAKLYFARASQMGSALGRERLARLA